MLSLPNAQTIVLPPWYWKRLKYWLALSDQSWKANDYRLGKRAVICVNFTINLINNPQFIYFYLSIGKRRGMTAADEDTAQHLWQLQGDSSSLQGSLLSQAPLQNPKPLLWAWGNGPTPPQRYSLTITALKLLMCSDTGRQKPGQKDTSLLQGTGA